MQFSHAVFDAPFWWQVDYSCELGKPVVTIADARREGAFHDPPPIAGPNSNLPDGQTSALPAVEAAPLQIRAAKCASFHPDTLLQDSFHNPGFSQVGKTLSGSWALS